MVKTDSLWYPEINQVRGWAIFMILLFHAGFLQERFFLGFLEYWNLYAVPIFFFISGLVLTLRYKDGLNIKPFYKKRFQYLVPAYLFWSIIAVIFIRGLNFQSFIDILTGDSPGIWFLFVLFQLYLLFPLLLKICKTKFGKWLFVIILSFVSISTMLIRLLPSFNWFYFHITIFQNEFINVNVSIFFWFIPFSIYFILGILIGYNYERFKQKLLQYKHTIILAWISLLIAIPIIIYFLNLYHTGYFNLEGIIFSFASIFFFFLVFTLKDSKFFDINGKLAVGFFLINPFVYVILWKFYFTAGWELFEIAFYLGLLFFIITSTLFFILTYRLWRRNFFYFSKKIAVAFFLIPTILFTLVLSFLSTPLISTFDFFIFSSSSFFVAYLLCLCLIAGIKKLPYYQYLLTEIRDENITTSGQQEYSLEKKNEPS